MSNLVSITRTVPMKHHSQQGATALARRIERYWRERGYHGIKVEIVRREYTEPGGLVFADFDIRSNMVNGYPPK